MSVVVMTIYNRTPEIIRAVFSGLGLPGNRPDRVVVCFDRAPDEAVDEVKRQCEVLGVPLQYSRLLGDGRLPRCPSLAWNTALDMVSESHAFCISSDVVLAPHSLGMAYKISEAHPEAIICGRAEHSGPSYYWKYMNRKLESIYCSRIMTWAFAPRPLGFNWLLPMSKVREVGGYDLAFMKGFCYEDDDFVLRMWRAGTDFVFCDDVCGFHIEHKRDNLRPGSKGVKINEDLFRERYGDIEMARLSIFQKYAWGGDGNPPPGIAVWFHEQRMDLVKKIASAQLDYGIDAPWRAIVPNEEGTISEAPPDFT